MNKQLYAVGMKGWVEIRSATKPPKLRVSEVAKSVKIKRWVYKPGFYDSQNRYHPASTKEKLFPKKFKLVSKQFEGGRRVGIVKTAKFGKLLCVVVRYGGMIELTAEMIDKLEMARVLKGSKDAVKTIKKASKGSNSTKVGE
jgi:hypothetical protein